MNTLLNSFNVEGISLMTGKPSKVEVKPSNKKGIFFFNKNSEQPVQAHCNNVVSTDNCTVIANQSTQARLIEHFMAAAALCGIDSCEVHMDFPEMPILDGSSKNWVEHFNEVGFRSCEKTEINFDKALYLEDGNTLLTLTPSNNFKVTYMVDFNHPDLNNRWVQYNSENKQEIIEARTFGYLKDLEKFQQMGLALGVSIDNTVGLTDDSYTTPLRSEFEPAKHKILDIIGDLYLSGYNPLNFNCHIIAKNAGHKTHVMFAKLIAEYLGVR